MVLDFRIPEEDFESTHFGSEEALLKLGNPISLLAPGVIFAKPFTQIK